MGQAPIQCLTRQREEEAQNAKAESSMREVFSEQGCTPRSARGKRPPSIEGWEEVAQLRQRLAAVERQLSGWGSEAPEVGIPTCVSGTQSLPDEDFFQLRKENVDLAQSNKDLLLENHKLRAALHEIETKKNWKWFDVVEHHYKQLEHHRLRMLTSDDADSFGDDISAGSVPTSPGHVESSVMGHCSRSPSCVEPTATVYLTPQVMSPKGTGRTARRVESVASAKVQRVLSNGSEDSDVGPIPLMSSLPSTRWEERCSSVGSLK